jgi:mono/diheme cytochrome c family protein
MLTRVDRVLVATVLALMGACGHAQRGELVGEPVTPDSATERRGERLFFRHCSHCHPGGEGGLGPALNDKPVPKLAITTQIRKGLGAMPAFSEDHLEEEEVDAIAEYVIDMRQTPVKEDSK